MQKGFQHFCFQLLKCEYFLVLVFYCSNVYHCLYMDQITNKNRLLLCNCLSFHQVAMQNYQWTAGPTCAFSRVIVSGSEKNNNKIPLIVLGTPLQILQRGLRRTNTPSLSPSPPTDQILQNNGTGNTTHSSARPRGPLTSPSRKQRNGTGWQPTTPPARWAHKAGRL